MNRLQTDLVLDTIDVNSAEIDVLTGISGTLTEFTGTTGTITNFDSTTGTIDTLNVNSILNVDTIDSTLTIQAENSTPGNTTDSILNLKSNGNNGGIVYRNIWKLSAEPVNTFGNAELFFKNSQNGGADDEFVKFSCLNDYVQFSKPIGINKIPDSGLDLDIDGNVYIDAGVTATNFLHIIGDDPATLPSPQYDPKAVDLVLNSRTRHDTGTLRESFWKFNSTPTDRFGSSVFTLSHDSTYYHNTIDTTDITLLTIDKDHEGNGNIVFNCEKDENVGIGSTSPTAKLDVNGDVVCLGITSQTFWTDIEYVEFDKPIGIGRPPNDPFKLDVDGGIYGDYLESNGTVQFGGISGAPTGAKGLVYFDNSTNKLRVYDGTSWVDLH